MFLHIGDTVLAYLYPQSCFVMALNFMGVDDCTCAPVKRFLSSWLKFIGFTKKLLALLCFSSRSQHFAFQTYWHVFPDLSLCCSYVWVFVHQMPCNEIYTMSRSLTLRICSQQHLSTWGVPRTMKTSTTKPLMNWVPLCLDSSHPFSSDFLKLSSHQKCLRIAQHHTQVNQAQSLLAGCLWNIETDWMIRAGKEAKTSTIMQTLNRCMQCIID